MTLLNIFKVDSHFSPVDAPAIFTPENSGNDLLSCLGNSLLCRWKVDDRNTMIKFLVKTLEEIGREVTLERSDGIDGKEMKFMCKKGRKFLLFYLFLFFLYTNV